VYVGNLAFSQAYECPTQRRGNRDSPYSYIGLELTHQLELDRAAGSDFPDTHALPGVDEAVAQTRSNDARPPQPLLEQRDAPLELRLLFPRIEILRVLRQVRLTGPCSAQALGHPAPLLALEPLELVAQPLKSLTRDHQLLHVAPLLSIADRFGAASPQHTLDTMRSRHHFADGRDGAAIVGCAQ
jgi:hypothetical protein